MVLKVVKYKFVDVYICFYRSSDLRPLDGSGVCGPLTALHVMLSEGSGRPSVVCGGVPLTEA